MSCSSLKKSEHVSSLSNEVEVRHIQMLIAQRNAEIMNEFNSKTEDLRLKVL